MKNDSTGVKLGIAFGFLVSLLIGVGWFELSRMGEVNAEVNRLFSQRWEKMELARQIVFYASSTYRITMKIALMKDAVKTEADLFPAERAENREKSGAAEEKIKAMIDSETEMKMLVKLDEARQQARTSQQKFFALLLNHGKTDEVRELMMNETVPALDRFRDTWSAFVQYEESQMNLAREETKRTYATARRLSMVLILMAIAVAIGIAVFATRKLTAEIQETEHAKIAIRKLNEDLEKKVSERTEELAQTVEALKGEVRDRKAREEDLRRLAAIVEYSDDAIIAVGLDGIITEWNAGAERMLGYSRSETIGKSITTITHPSYPDEAFENQARLKRGHSVVRRESVRVRKDGKLVHVALTVSPIKDQEGHMTGTSGILRDITGRKLMEDAVQRSEASFQSFVENAPFGILRTTPDGRIVQANPALVNMLGYASEQEVLGLRMDTDVYRYPEERREATAWCQRQDSIQGIEVDWKHKSGRPFTIRCDAHVVRDSDGNLEYLEGFIEDISERRAMEMQLRQGQKMEAIGRLAGGIAHDFNNLLGVIIGYSDLVLEQIGRDSSLHNPVEQIKKAGDRASALTRQLLAFSRQQVLETKVLDLNTIIDEMAKMLPPLLGEHIELQTSLAPTLGRVKADEGQIEQVIMNLAVNARDAMPEGGRLRIETRNSHLDEEFAARHQPTIPGDYVMLIVSDTGSGMDAQTQAHIFEPFFTTKEQGRGTGLGLATVYGFVKQSGGYVWVQSEPGIGSTFTIYLPLAYEAVLRTETGDGGTAQVRGAETILLVEDEESLRTLTRSQLEESGYTVLEANCGSEAIRIARQHRGPIHILLTDVVMPGMNGRVVAANMAASRPETRVVYMSGYTGFSDYGLTNLDAVMIQKPFTRHVLLQRIREAIALEEKSQKI
jgi:two-component system, cell cycle sensor histidine kinase and response regulator CckA